MYFKMAAVVAILDFGTILIFKMAVMAAILDLDRNDFSYL